MKTLLLLLFLLHLCLFSFTQTVNMDVLMGVKNIGQITAQKKTTGKTVNAALSSKVSVSMFIKVNVDQTIVSQYKDGKLMKADMERISNISSENKKTAVVWHGSEYIIKKDTIITYWESGKSINKKDTITIIHKEPVTFCVLDLYFTEPVGLTRIFGETGGTYMPIKALAEHRYELQVNDSKKDIFMYGDDGKLIQVESVIATKKVTFKVR